MIGQALAYHLREVADMGGSLARRAAGIHRLPASIKVKSSPEGYRRFAVLCLYEQQPRYDLTRLLALLRRNGHYIVLASTNGSSRNYAELSDAEIVVTSFGRDFTAYKGAFALLDKATMPRPGTSLIFLNDSVWFFEKYHEELVSRLEQATATEQLVAGALTADEVPHVSGWLFGTPFSEPWRRDLRRLFTPHFVSRSRNYHIKYGEHRILPSMAGLSGIAVIQPNRGSPAINACYTALRDGTECFYLKADAQLRTEPRHNQLERFLQVNAGPHEASAALQWLAGRSWSLHADPYRMADITTYRRRHFSQRPSGKEEHPVTEARILSEESARPTGSPTGSSL